MIKFIFAIAAAFALAHAGFCNDAYDGGLEDGDGGYGNGIGGNIGGSIGGDIGGGMGGGLDDGIGGGTGGDDASYGGKMVKITSGGYGDGDMDEGHGNYGHEINVAIHSKHYIKSIPVHSTGGHGVPTLVNVDAGVAPIVLLLKSRSSPIIPRHHHIGQHGSFHKSFSADKPHKMVHTIHKPVIHELQEIVFPYRRHTQKVQPVKQSIRTYVHRRNNHGYDKY